MAEFVEEILIWGALVLSTAITIIAIPPILRVARAKHLYEPFDPRKIHNQNIPPLGGVAIFLGFVISTIIATDGYTFDSLKYIIASVILVFFIGLKDDLIIISPKKKLLIQIFAASLLTVTANIRFTNLHGILGIYEINYFSSLILTLFTIIVIINAFNLVDGIDGLASGLAILAAGTFGVWFYFSGNIPFAIMSFALVGSLAGFFVYNVFGHKNKLFMGDSGSLVIGLVISTLVIIFNEENIIKSTSFAVESAPSVAFAIVIVPMIDTIRVMLIRTIEKRSPFSSDNNHVHHRLLKLVRSHFMITLIIVSVNAFIIGIAILLNAVSVNVNLQFIFIFLIGVIFSVIPSILIRVKKRKQKINRPVVKNLT